MRPFRISISDGLVHIVLGLLVPQDEHFLDGFFETFEVIVDETFWKRRKEGKEKEPTAVETESQSENVYS